MVPETVESVSARGQEEHRDVLVFNLPIVGAFGREHL
jgi:hypothetical protein